MVDVTTRDYDEKIKREIQKTELRLTRATHRLYYDRGDLAKIFFYNGWSRRLHKCLYKIVGV